MASLYKKPVILVDPVTGEKKKEKSRKWWGRFRDENGEDKRVPLAVDKKAAQTMLNEWVVRAERLKAGIIDPTERHRKRPLADHVKDYKASLENRNSTPDYVQTTIQRVNDVIAGCKFERIDHISASTVQAYLADLRTKGPKGDGKRRISFASSNHYLRAIKMFTRWLVRDRRTYDDRLMGLSALNAALDRKRIRRPLSSDEFVLLLDAAENGPEIQKVSGPDRAILYIVGAYTGYRRNEIGSVTTDSFDFDSDPPTLTVEAGHSKHRRKDVLPIRRDLAERIRGWIAAKGDLKPGVPLFAIKDKRTAEMMEADLNAARENWIEEAPVGPLREARERTSFLKYLDANKHYADFHSLRKTFITNLARAGVTPKAAQLLARHSDINLTMNTYTTLGVFDQAAAVESLPPVPSTQQAELRATGTDGRVLRVVNGQKAKRRAK